MEQFRYKEMTLELYRRLRSNFRDYPYLGCGAPGLPPPDGPGPRGTSRLGRRESLPISIRLVKGAYWDYETVIAKQNDWDIPVYTVKAESDAAFERLRRRSWRTMTSVTLPAAPTTSGAYRR